MTIRFRCGCGKSLRVSDSLAETKVRCPSCAAICTAHTEQSIDSPPQSAQPFSPSFDSISVSNAPLSLLRDQDDSDQSESGSLSPKTKMEDPFAFLKDAVSKGESHSGMPDFSAMSIGSDQAADTKDMAFQGTTIDLTSDESQKAAQEDSRDMKGETSWSSIPVPDDPLSSLSFPETISSSEPDARLPDGGQAGRDATSESVSDLSATDFFDAQKSDVSKNRNVSDSTTWSSYGGADTFSGANMEHGSQQETPADTGTGGSLPELRDSEKTLEDELSRDSAEILQPDVEGHHDATSSLVEEDVNLRFEDGVNFPTAPIKPMNVRTEVEPERSDTEDWFQEKQGPVLDGASSLFLSFSVASVLTVLVLLIGRQWWFAIGVFCSAWVNLVVYFLLRRTTRIEQEQNKIYRQLARIGAILVEISDRQMSHEKEGTESNS
ncbi:MAG: hypothetical protein MK103_14365 [Planctomycetes bacterium]|nr:hypothetical protein [Planctomycetota bacterium]